MDFLEKILKEKANEVNNLTPVEKRVEKQRPSFYQTVKGNPKKVHIIGEIKRASPSKGLINGTVDILQQAKTYEKAGVSAISVLTDPVFFNGTIHDLTAVAQVVDVPVLCKDFIIDEQQIVRAKQAGASLILLIVAALPKVRLKELHEYATELGLEVLVETHDAQELAIAKEIGATIIGVNNRNLKTFQVSLQTSIDLSQPEGRCIYISESGFKTAQDVEKISQNYQGILVGETLMRAGNVEEKVKELQVSRR